MSLLDSLFKKRGITDVNKLSDEEKETFKHWEGILSKGEATVDDIVKFCDNQIKRIGISLRNLDNPEKKNERLVIQLGVYSTLLDLIKGPQLEKEALEKYLETLISK